jgi:hypothetical protein
MVERYRAYLERTDHLLDEPSVRVIERILDGYARMLRERAEFCGELATPPKHDEKAAERWSQLLSVPEFVPHGAAGTLARAS